MGVRARRYAYELLASDESRVVLATGRYIGEGFDDPRLDTLVLAMPIAWKGTMTQYAGRLHRHHARRARAARSAPSPSPSYQTPAARPAHPCRARTAHRRRRAGQMTVSR